MTKLLLLLHVLLLLLIGAAAGADSAKKLATPADEDEPETSAPAPRKPVELRGEEQPLVPSSGRPVRRVYDPVSGLFCELVGDCHACPVSEKDEAYCRETGNREEMRCPRAPESTKKMTPADDEGSLPEIRFRACVPAEKVDPARSVLFFELVMAVSLAGAYVLLRREQQKHMSSFDLRKDPRQRGSLLGSAGAGGQKGAD